MFKILWSLNRREWTTDIIFWENIWENSVLFYLPVKIKSLTDAKKKRETREVVRQLKFLYWRFDLLQILTSHLRLTSQSTKKIYESAVAALLKTKPLFDLPLLIFKVEVKFILYLLLLLSLVLLVRHIIQIIYNRMSFHAYGETRGAHTRNWDLHALR